MLADDTDALVFSKSNAVKQITSEEVRRNLVWKNIFRLGFFHVGFVFACSVYGFGLSAVPIKWLTVLWAVIGYYVSGIGITAGVHRLWSHRAYKATLGLRIMLMLMYSAAGLYGIFYWVKDHRIHHKYSDTDADPHNVKRGFFFSHIGWLMVERHPEYRRRQKEIDLSDIIADPVVMFNKKYERELFIIFCIAIPVAVPVIFWGETLLHAILTQCFIRFVFTLHCTLSVNSVAHLWGYRPYNRVINPAENSIVSLLTAGEGFHNYHHTFPWDYKASEWPYLSLNYTTLFIHALWKIGWAYDLREPSPALVQKVIHEIGHKSNASYLIH
ncbi:acyl-CoA Delta-9 desaturase-like isoform X1 [Neodiprion pinetum]|uniref:acyl-CoA Delta-9 desaturase-like isoform X1 n=1 Tax=Neodiprion pinetum TaxID=441929 RepID=UPI001EDF8EC7|nr:acyl-CoA Delta-9 desaturase-like isoform X1 [Neodiprion pinetum]